MSPLTTWLNLALKYYPVASAGSTAVMGGREIATYTNRADKEHNPSSRVTKAAHKRMKGGAIENEFRVVRGLVYGASGVMGTLAALHEIRLWEVGSAVGVLSYAAARLFFLGNALTVYHCSKKLHALFESFPKADKAAKESIKQEALSAILGLFSGLGYITSALVAFLGGAAAAVIALTILATVTQWTNSLYDWLMLMDWLPDLSQCVCV